MLAPQPRIAPATQARSFPARLALLCAFVASTAMAPSANAELIQNGSFEAQLIADGSLQALVPTGWSGGAVLMNPDAAGGFAGNPFTWPQAADGLQYEDIGNTAQFALSQVFSVASGGSYSLSWLDNTALNILPGFQTAPYAVAIRDAASALVFSSNLDSYHADGAWGSRAFVQALAAGSYTLTFTSLNSANRTDTLIDRVSLVPTTASIPEPSAAWLLGLGLLALFAANGSRLGQPRSSH